VDVDNKYHYPHRRSGYPASFEIRFGDPDTTWWFQPKFAVNFSVWNVYENKKMLFMLEEPNEATRDSSISVSNPQEYIRILIDDEAPQPREIWRVNFSGPPVGADTLLPEDGDVYRIRIETPFRSGDVYQFTSQEAKIEKKLARTELKDIAVVPNPYVVAARWEPTRLLASGRGERRIFFIHLPQQCTIRIYTVSGDYVNTLEHYSTMLDGSESWDLKSEEGLDVAPGIYIYHVDASDLGETIGKFAQIK
jgi:hypothetical protein